jgi:hypothetical protein
MPSVWGATVVGDNGDSSLFSLQAPIHLWRFKMGDMGNSESLLDMIMK